MRVRVRWDWCLFPSVPIDLDAGSDNVPNEHRAQSISPDPNPHRQVHACSFPSSAATAALPCLFPAPSCPGGRGRAEEIDHGKSGRPPFLPQCPWRRLGSTSRECGICKQEGNRQIHPSPSRGRLGSGTPQEAPATAEKTTGKEAQEVHCE